MKNADLASAKEAGAKSEKKTRAIEKQLALARNKAERSAARLARLNPFDGLIHNADHTREFIDGGKVEGANTSEYIGQTSENIQSLSPDEEIAAQERK